MKIPARRVQELLSSWPVARLGTRGGDGRPRLVPIVFVHLEGELWSPIDGKPKRGGELARERDLRGDPRVCVLLDAYRADWERLWWIALDAEARTVTVRAAAEQGLDERCARAESELRLKYPQYARVPLFSGDPRWIVLRIERIRSWCWGPKALVAGDAGAV